MPNTREKPMGRLTLPHYGGNGHYMKCSEQFGCSGECADCEELDKIVERLAYYEDMIANGVTVQKWIPVTERLPEKNEFDWVLVVVELHSQYGIFHSVPIVAELRHGEWYDHNDETIEGEFEKVTHWMPLPEPPKGE